MNRPRGEVGGSNRRRRAAARLLATACCWRSALPRAPSLAQEVPIQTIDDDCIAGSVIAPDGSVVYGYAALEAR